MTSKKSRRNILLGVQNVKRRKTKVYNDFEEECFKSKKSINLLIYIYDEDFKLQNKPNEEVIKNDCRLWFNKIKSSLAYNKSLYKKNEKFEEMDFFIVLKKGNIDLPHLQKTLGKNIEGIMKSIKYEIDLVEFKIILIYTGHGNENEIFEVPQFKNKNRKMINMYEIHKVIENLEIDGEKINPILNITIGNCCRKITMTEDIKKLDVEKFSGFELSIFDFVGSCLIFSSESGKPSFYGEKISFFSECFWDYWQNDWVETLISVNNVLQYQQRAVLLGTLKQNVNRKIKGKVIPTENIFDV